MRLLPLLPGLALLCVVLPQPLSAQLVSQEVRDASRICTYAGTETLADGEVVPKRYVVGIGQECPYTAPARDPNGQVPGNARLEGERVSGDGRFCLYGQGGVQYQVRVSVSVPCAMTPALLERAVAEAQEGAR